MEMQVEMSVRLTSGPSIGSGSVINVDEIEEVSSKVEERGERWTVQEVHRPAKSPKKWACKGFLVIFPEGTNHHLSYPFGIHGEQSVPWN